MANNSTRPSLQVKKLSFSQVSKKVTPKQANLHPPPLSFVLSSSECPEKAQTRLSDSPSCMENHSHQARIAADVVGAEEAVAAEDFLNPLG